MGCRRGREEGRKRGEARSKGALVGCSGAEARRERETRAERGELECWRQRVTERGREKRGGKQEGGGDVSCGK